MESKTTVLLFMSCCCLACGCAAPRDAQHVLPPFGANLPEGYSLVYEANFGDQRIFTDFDMTDPETWAGKEAGGLYCLELLGPGAYEPEVRSPLSIALLTTMKVGDFVLEADVESTDINGGGHRDICFFFGFVNPSRYYYVHLAAKADPNAHNIFLVNDAPRTNIATHTTGGVCWGTGVRHRVRIERTVDTGVIRVYFDDMTDPIMEACDKTFGPGYVGMGSFDNSARFYAFNLYSSQVDQTTQLFFEKAGPAEGEKSPVPPAEQQEK